jgi:hypothetical protein
VLVAKDTMEQPMSEIAVQYIGQQCTGSSVYSIAAFLQLIYVQRLLLG